VKIGFDQTKRKVGVFHKGILISQRLSPICIERGRLSDVQKYRAIAGIFAAPSGQSSLGIEPRLKPGLCSHGPLGRRPDSTTSRFREMSKLQGPKGQENSAQALARVNIKRRLALKGPE
jgi:hypothetical protein